MGKPYKKNWVTSHFEQSENNIVLTLGRSFSFHAWIWTRDSARKEKVLESLTIAKVFKYKINLIVIFLLYNVFTVQFFSSIMKCPNKEVNMRKTRDMKQRCAHQVLKCHVLLGGRIDGGQGPIVLELNQRQLSLARLLVYQVVVVLKIYTNCYTRIIYIQNIINVGHVIFSNLHSGKSAKKLK